MDSQRFRRLWCPSGLACLHNSNFCTQSRYQLYSFSSDRMAHLFTTHLTSSGVHRIRFRLDSRESGLSQATDSPKGMTFVFYVSRPIFFENQCGRAEKQTNHQKINTVLHRGHAKCDGQEAFARGTIDDTIDEKQLISNRPPSCSAAKKQTKEGHLSRSLLPLFRVGSPSLSRPVSAHSPT